MCLCPICCDPVWCTACRCQTILSSSCTCSPSAGGAQHARNYHSSSPASHPSCCGTYGALSCTGLRERPGEVSQRSTSARAGQAMVYKSVDSHLGVPERKHFSVDSRDTGTSPVLFEAKYTSAAVERASAAGAGGSSIIPARQSHSAPRSSHRTGGSAHYIEMQRKVQQCQDVLRRQTAHVQVCLPV